MIRRAYIQSIAPLTIYLGRSFPRHVCSLSVTYMIFCRFFTELVLAMDLRLCKKQSFRIVAGYTLICYSFLLSGTRIQGIRRIEVVVSYLLCQA